MNLFSVGIKLISNVGRMDKEPIGMLTAKANRDSKVMARDMDRILGDIGPDNNITDRTRTSGPIRILTIRTSVDVHAGMA